MKQTMKKRITALLLVFSLAALLSLSAFAEDASTTADPSVGAEASDATGSEAGSAGTTASGAVTITGEVYYGTDYVQFDINGGSANNLFYDVLYNGNPVYQHVYYTPDDRGVNSVGIDLEDLGDDYSDVTQYSIQVYTGRAVSATNKPIAQASMAGIYARPNGDPQQDVLIGSVVNGTDVGGIEPPPTYYDQVTDTDYNLVSEGMQYDGTKYYAEYKPYVPTPLDGSITYVDNQGNILETDTISPKIKPENTGADAIVVELKDRLEIQNGTETLNYYPVLETVTADYYGQIDFVVLCNAYASTEGETGLVKIHYTSGGEDILVDEVNLTTTTYLYTVPDSFVQIDAESGKATQYKLKDDDQLNEYHQLVLVPGRAESDYYFEYEATAADEVISWNLILMDGTTNTRLGTETMDVEPGETVEFNAAAHAPAGYVPSQETYTYTYGGENLVQYVYYTPDGYVPTESYTVTLQFVNIADGAVLQSESVMVNPGADTEITCPAEFTAGDNTYVRLGGQSDTYRHSYYSPKRTYTIYYRDVNDTLYANTIITNIETVTTERTETGVTYVEDVTTVTGGTVTGPAYATGPAAGTGITGITDDTTGMNQAVNEEGQGLAQEREEQIAEGETPLAQSPGGETTPEESITDNDTAKSGLSTALMTGGTVAALVVAIVLVVLIVVQRKRNRSTRR